MGEKELVSPRAQLSLGWAVTAPSLGAESPGPATEADPLVRAGGGLSARQAQSHRCGSVLPESRAQTCQFQL